MKIRNPFKRKEEKLEPPSVYAVIKWKDSVMREGLCLSESVAKEIHLIQDGDIADILQFTPSYIDYLEKDLEIPVVDETKGIPYPEVCVMSPRIVVDLGRIKVRW